MNDWKSEALDKIAPALLAAQMKLAPVMREFKNPAFPKSKYADLNSVLEAVNEAFHPAGLMLTQLPMPLHSGDGSVVGLTIRTVVLHTSGQWIASDLPFCPDMTNPQKIGGCVTYGRRYGAVAAAGLMQEDDDGETATGRGNGHDYSRQPEPERRGGNGDGNYPPPATGKALYGWAKAQNEKYREHDIDMVVWLGKWGQRENLPSKLYEWTNTEAKKGYETALAQLDKHLVAKGVKSEDNE